MRKAARPTTKADETPEFVEFWAIWKPYANEFDGRGSARNEFFRHVEEYGVDPRDIIDGARWYIRSGGNQKLDKDGNPVRQHAQSWLNKYQYEDGCESERAFQAKQAERAENIVRMEPRSGQTAFLKAFNKREA